MSANIACAVMWEKHSSVVITVVEISSIAFFHHFLFKIDLIINNLGIRDDVRYPYSKVTSVLLNYDFLELGVGGIWLCHSLIIIII